jgi:formylmethanofuran dehydrogenase subunit C
LIKLQPAKAFNFPIVADCISPDVFQNSTTNEISELTIWEGNKKRKLGDLFKIKETEDPESQSNVAIEIIGDVSEVRKIGSHLKTGEITIKGNAGMHLGEEMTQGKITVYGNAGAWAGSMMNGGTIEIHGNAGDYLAAPYRGSTKGMQGGKIIVRGNAGNEVGARMKKGIIEIHGNSGQFLGLRMHDGTIHVRGDCDERAGACMVNGKIVVDGTLHSVLPTFTIDSIKPKVKIEENDTAEGPYYLFLGDLAEGGNGKLYVSKQKNPHLSYREKFL